jgi:non-ribosomal peptide synthetase component E (peptide arylation enzyme)
MQVLVNIPDELAAQIQARGFALETCLRELMEEKFSLEPIQEPIRDGQRRQAVEAMRGFSERLGATLGGLDLKSMVHEGHKY